MYLFLYKLYQFQFGLQLLLSIQKIFMKKMIILIAILLVFSASKLVLEDNFNNFNFKNWRHDITLSGGGDWQFQLYDNNRSTTFVKDGVLNIKPVLTETKIGANNVKNGFNYNIWGGSPADQCTGNNFYGCERDSNGYYYINPVMSGKLTTVNSVSIEYGKVQVRAKIPKGDWLWPRISLLPRYNQYGTFPASGEIKIMESRGNVGYPKSNGGGPQTFTSTLHWGPDYNANQWSKTSKQYSLSSGTLADDFHTYGLYWDDKVIYTYIDNETNRVLQVNHTSQSYWSRSGITNRENPWQYSTSNSAPFDKQFYLSIELAVGGVYGYFADGVGLKPWSDSSYRASGQFYDKKSQWFPTWSNASTFQIDSVKIWDFRHCSTTSTS